MTNPRETKGCAAWIPEKLNTSQDVFENKLIQDNL